MRKTAGDSCDRKYLRCSTENNVVQPDIDHIEEPMMECCRPPRISLKQSTLCQELFQHRSRQWFVGDRGRVMWVEIRRVDLDCFDRFVVPPPKVILSSSDMVSPVRESHLAMLTQKIYHHVATSVLVTADNLSYVVCKAFSQPNINCRTLISFS